MASNHQLGPLKLSFPEYRGANENYKQGSKHGHIRCVEIGLMVLPSSLF